MKQNEHVILSVTPGSIAEEMELEPGDVLLAVNDKEIEDIFDYQFFCEDTKVCLLVKKQNGEEWELEIEKDEDEDIGIQFQNGLMDDYRSCHNKCMFCFIDQMPKGMRETLYFKDDDSRLSFLQGNYVTLTNMKERDIDRIIEYHLEPINISFHTTNPELRCKMLHNRFAGEAFRYVHKLYGAGIIMNGQIVLCKGINDGAELDRSIRELSAFIPYLQSVSVVPVGLTKFRQGLYPLESFEREDARQVLELIHSWQDRLYREHGTHFIHAGDEWYILAEQRIPNEDNYDGYLQLENGVGMVRLFLDEFEEAYKNLDTDSRKIEISMVTGVSAYSYIKQSLEQLQIKFPNLCVHLYKVINHFFGEKITVTGLLTGQDIVEQLKGRELGDALLLPSNVLKAGEPIFLDDMTLEQLERELDIKVRIVKSSGQDFADAVLMGI